MIYLLDSDHMVAHLNGNPRLGNRIAHARQTGDEFGIAIMGIPPSIMGNGIEFPTDG